MLEKALFGSYNVLRRLGVTRLLWRLPGVLKVARFFYDRLRPSGIQKAQLDGYVLYYDADDPVIGKRYVLGDEHEKNQKLALSHLVNRGDFVIDVGANIGDYTILFSRLVGESGIVWSFEPHPRLYSILEMNIRKNGCKNVICFQTALSDVSEKRVMYEDAGNWGNNSFSAKFVQITGTMGNNFEVDSRRLESFLIKEQKRPSLIKIDVQGAEAKVLRGLGGFFRDSGTSILMEFDPRALGCLGEEAECFLRWISDSGRKIRIFDGKSFVLSDENSAYRAACVNKYIDILC